MTDVIIVNLLPFPVDLDCHSRESTIFPRLATAEKHKITANPRAGKLQRVITPQRSVRSFRESGERPLGVDWPVSMATTVKFVGLGHPQSPTRPPRPPIAGAKSRTESWLPRFVIGRPSWCCYGVVFGRRVGDLPTSHWM